MKQKTGLCLTSLTALCLASGSAFGALYSEDFNVDNSANWTINDPGVTDILVDFSYDYSAIGVPSANGSDTLGLKMTANNSAAVFGGFSVSPTGESFGTNYTVTFDMWQNYVGPLGAGGSGTTQLSMMGVGTSGSSAVYPGVVSESVMFGVTLDGGSSVDYRAYSSAAVTGYPEGDPVFAAPGGARNGSAAYYSVFGGASAPAAQTLLYPAQTGVTDSGETAFQWVTVEMVVAGNTTTFSIDGLLIATVDTSSLTLGGSNFLLGHADTNSSSSSDPNDYLLNITLIDNVVVTPEPASLALMGLGGLAMIRRR